MANINLAIVGCGGMGTRHLRGLAELQKHGLSEFNLVALCDPVLDNANLLADEAAERFGTRPAVVPALAELAVHGVQAVDITTTPRYHHTLAVEALELGWHVMCEKPVGLTVECCRRIREAQSRTGRVLSVAENYRRDPMNRLARAVLASGAIGEPRLMIHNTLGGADRMTISVWRHMKDQSGVLLDVGVHFTDILEYYLGPAVTAYGQVRLHEPVRRNPAAGKDNDMSSNPAGIYGRWQKVMPATFEPTAEDAAYGTITHANGAVTQFVEDHAGHGRGMFQRLLFGARGSMDLPNDRSGQPVTVHLADGKSLTGDEVLDLVPDFRLEEATATLFGGERLGGYDLPFTEVDPRIIAIEYAELGQVLTGRKPAVEVDIEQGMRSVALVYALMESSLLNRAVTMDEVLVGSVNGYQAEIDEALFP